MYIRTRVASFRPLSRYRYNTHDKTQVYITIWLTTSMRKRCGKKDEEEEEEKGPLYFSNDRNWIDVSFGLLLHLSFNFVSLLFKFFFFPLHLLHIFFIFFIQPSRTRQQRTNKSNSCHNPSIYTQWSQLQI